MKSMKDGTNLFVADTYAFVEIINGNQNYMQYVDFPVVTTTLHLLELYYHVLRLSGEEVADFYLIKYGNLVVSITPAIIKRSMLFRRQFSKDNLSYADCVGYALAQELGCKFLTGDIKFKGKDGVEFVR